MRPDPYRIGQFGQIGPEPLGKSVSQGLQLGCPGYGLVPRSLKMQIQQPAPAIGPLDPVDSGRSR